MAGEGPGTERAAAPTKVQEDLLLFPLHEQLVVAQEVCILLLLDLLDNGFCLLEQGHGQATSKTPPIPNVRRPLPPTCLSPGPGAPDAAPDPGPGKARLAFLSTQFFS